MTPLDIAALAKEAQPKEIWITHLYPQVDAKIALEIIGNTGIRVRRANDLDQWRSPK